MSEHGERVKNWGWVNSGRWVESWGGLKNGSWE